MRHQGKITFILTLMLISLISVGFSSWKLSDEGTIYGNIKADNVINAGEYIKYNADQSNLNSKFVYSEDGFVVINPAYTSSNYEGIEPYLTSYDVSFDVVYDLDFQTLVGYLTAGNHITTVKEAIVTFTLAYSNKVDENVISLFKGEANCSDALKELSTGSVNAYSQISPDKSARYFKRSISFSKENKKQELLATKQRFQITYTISVSDNHQNAEYFKANIYPSLSKIEFEMQTELTVVY